MVALKILRLETPTPLRLNGLRFLPKITKLDFSLRPKPPSSSGTTTTVFALKTKAIMFVSWLIYNISCTPESIAAFEKPILMRRTSFIISALSFPASAECMPTSFMPNRLRTIMFLTKRSLFFRTNFSRLQELQRSHSNAPSLERPISIASSTRWLLGYRSRWPA